MFFQYDQNDSKELNAVDKTKFDDVGEDDDDDEAFDDEEGDEGEEDVHRWNLEHEIRELKI